ncbi:hypothetical protein Tco_1516572, partial [Tanacetum coccineum]
VEYVMMWNPFDDVFPSAEPAKSFLSTTTETGNKDAKKIIPTWNLSPAINSANVADHELDALEIGDDESEPEDGEMVSDSMIGEKDGGQEIGESHLVEHQFRSPSPMPVEDEMPKDTLGDMEVSYPLLTMEDNEEGEIEADETTPESSADELKNDENDEAGFMAEEAEIDDIPTATTTTSI